MAGIATTTPDWRMEEKNSQDVKTLISANGIHPISDELLIKNASVIDNVIKIIFLSNLGFNLL